MFNLKVKDKINKKSVISKGNTSKHIYVFPFFIFGVCLIYSLMYHFNFAILGIPIIFFIISYLNIEFLSIYLTGNSIYVFRNGKVIFSVNLLENFQLIKVEQTKIGEHFNYGNLTIVNNDGKFYIYKYLHDPIVFKNKVIKRFYKLMKQKDPNYTLPDDIYEEVFNNKKQKDNNKKLDSLDKVEETKEDKIENVK